jgi:hypothetical protein
MNGWGEENLQITKGGFSNLRKKFHTLAELKNLE